MKSVNIARIEIDNPVLTSYTKTIQSWGGGNLPLTEKGFYAIYLDDRFLAASTIEEQETSDILISLVNGSNVNYDRVQTESKKKLLDIVTNEYGENRKVKIQTLGR